MLRDRSSSVVDRVNPILDFILAHAREDERPYLTVSILGNSVVGLLDTGASRTIVGRKGWSLLQSLGFGLDSTKEIYCTVANGQKLTALGVVQVPFELENKTAWIEVVVVPDLSHFLIFGVDFFRKMGIVPDLRSGKWNFSNIESEILPHLASIVDTKEPRLSIEQSMAVGLLVDKYFSKMNGKLGCVKNVEHHIRLIDPHQPPIKQRYYPVSPVIQKEIDKQIEEMEVNDVIEKSDSDWASPILMVPKKDGSWRFCIDFRKVNAVTQRDAYPLPYISSILDRLKNAKYISSLDIKSGYWNIPLSEESKKFTAFTVPGRGLWQFKRLAFGLHSAPATFQKFIDKILGPELEPFVFKYLDDIIIIAETFEKHLEILDEVLKRIIDAGFTLNRDKCHFVVPELKYLGYVVNANGLTVDPDKVSAILKIPTPTTVAEVRRMIGVAGWYKRFIPHYSDICAPLNRLTRKSVKLVWDDNCNRAWNTIKQHLISAPILSCPDFSLPFVIQTDASSYGLGAVLTQSTTDGEKVVCYLSRSLSRLERRYTTTELECLAVLWAIEKLRSYVEGSHFTVVTDHHSLCWLHNLKDPCGRLARWAIRLQQYDFKIIHRKGRDHHVPDTLSRSVPVLDSCEIDNKVKQSTLCSWYRKMLEKVSLNPLQFPAWREENGILYHYHKNIMSGLASKEENWKRVIPRVERNDLLKQMHDDPTSGHLGVFKTYNRVLQKYYWPHMRADIARYVRNCKTCLANKVERKLPAGLMVPRFVVDRPWKQVSIDLVGPMVKSTSGYQYILTVIDTFSKFLLTFPLRKATAISITKILENNVFLLFGSPESIIVDNGTQFRGKEFRKLASDYKIKLRYTANYHAQANTVERVHSTLKQCIRSYISENQRKWEDSLQKVSCAIRTSVHESIKVTPYFVNFGREINFPERMTDSVPDEIDVPTDVNEHIKVFKGIYSTVRERLQRASENTKRRYDLRRRDVQYLPNELVWRRNHALSDASKYFTAALAPKYTGPFVIAKKLSPWTYELKDQDGKHRGVWHAKDLKSHPQSTTD